MNKYEIIYESLCDQVENGELLLEDANIINELAYNKYIIEKEEVYDQIKEKRRFKKMDKTMTNIVLGTIDGINIFLHCNYKDKELTDDDIQNIKNRYSKVEPAFKNRYAISLKEWLNDASQGFTDLNLNIRPSSISYKVKENKSYFIVDFYTKATNKEDNIKQNVLIECDLIFRNNKLIDENVRSYSIH